ncbi:MAG: fibrobacter succinogenes major paralogous domain-containing protein [Flavobacterium sp.]|uniref:fibrobacter succinogenes major paralogous domain-containing protein n=1 Tax=Flavobacterium sp. TaxID=239 RepID=UPI003BD3753A
MNYIKQIFLFLIILNVFTIYSQKVSNINYRQEQSSIIISYDLETKTSCKISLFVSTDDGKTWQGPLKKVTGDAGAKIATGNHSITWNVLEEFEELRGDKIKFQVKADSGNIETVVIGSQEWTVKNLDVSTYRNGDIIPEVKDPEVWANLKTGAWCYYDNDPKNGAIYGKLYNWYAVNDPRGLAPEGFHIPSDEEWTILTDYLGGENVANLKDLDGFSGLPGGIRYGSGTYSRIGVYGEWWSSSEAKVFDSDCCAWFRILYYLNGYPSRDRNNKDIGFSLRCVKD